MAAVKTYCLAPNFTFHPNTSICMGDIVQDPSDRTKPLSSPADPTKLEIESHVDYKVSLTNSSSSSLKGSVWVKFLETAQARTGGGASGDVLDRYTMTQLDTVYLRKHPTDEEAEDRVKDRKVKAAINSGVLGKKPVFMITGLKIARGFRLQSGKSGGVESEVTLEASVLDGIGAGVNIEVKSSRGAKVESRVAKGQDIIFAYQLHVIAHRGWKKQVDIPVYKPKGAFLSDEQKEATEEPVEVVAAGLEDVTAFDEEMPVHTLTAKDGDAECICISFPDDD